MCCDGSEMRSQSELSEQPRRSFSSIVSPAWNCQCTGFDSSQQLAVFWKQVDGVVIRSTEGRVRMGSVGLFQTAMTQIDGFSLVSMAHDTEGITLSSCGPRELKLERQGSSSGRHETDLKIT